MICSNCSKDFHYCPSCGFYPEAELGCCSIDCAKKYLDMLIDQSHFAKLAEHVFSENPIALGNQRIFEEPNKAKLGTAIVDHIRKNSS